jgi:hypothetical protein
MREAVKSLDEVPKTTFLWMFKSRSSEVKRQNMVLYILLREAWDRYEVGDVCLMSRTLNVDVDPQRESQESKDKSTFTTGPWAERDDPLLATPQQPASQFHDFVARMRSGSSSGNAGTPRQNLQVPILPVGEQLVLGQEHEREMDNRHQRTP